MVFTNIFLLILILFNQPLMTHHLPINIHMKLLLILAQLVILFPCLILLHCEMFRLIRMELKSFCQMGQN